MITLSKASRSLLRALPASIQQLCRPATGHPVRQHPEKAKGKKGRRRAGGGRRAESGNQAESKSPRMENVILIPDSFKGTMRSATICQIMKRCILRHFPACIVQQIPIADGGEGTVDAFLDAYGKGEKQFFRVRGPFREDVDAFIGFIGRTAVIEMASCAGLPLTRCNRNPLITTTYGVGQLVRKALDLGCNKIIVGLGGSGTNDGGCGMASALGARFMDSAGKEFLPTGGSLQRIARIDLSLLDPRLKEIRLEAICDIDNPLYGPSGAAYVFGPQKGADAGMLETLDNGLRHLAETVYRELGIDKSLCPGSGAAGGCGYGMGVFLQAGLRMGIDTLLDAVDFENCLALADYVFTGEGRLDSQSARGKVVCGIARRAQAAGVPVIAIAGDIGDDADAVYEQGVSAVFSTNRKAVDFSIARAHCERDLEKSMDNVVRLLKIAEGSVRPRVR